MIKGSHMSMESRGKISLAGMGRKNHLGHKHSEVSRIKMSLSRIGKKQSEETKKKRGNTMKQKYANGFVGAKGMHHTEEWKNYMSKISSLNRVGKKASQETRWRMSVSHLGKKLSEAQRKKMSISMKLNGHMPPILKGEKNSHWKGGVTPLYFSIRGLREMDEWRIAVFERDGYKCLRCKDDTGGNLNAHHVKPFIQILNEYGVKNIDDAIACLELWRIDNGVTLCSDCHKKEHAYRMAEEKESRRTYIELLERIAA